MGFGDQTRAHPHREGPTTPLAVSQYIGEVLRRQRALIEELKPAEERARELRREAKKAEARAYLRAEGPAHERRYKAALDEVADRADGEADVAEVAVKYLRDRLRLCGDEIDGARTTAATLRKEFETLGMGDEGA